MSDGMLWTLQECYVEINRLRSLALRRSEQIAAVRALHRKWPPLEHPTNQDFCKHDGQPWPCATAAALDGTS